MRYNLSIETSQSRRPKLTPRQLEILCLIAKGMTTKEIAGSLHISVKTVETHRKQIMERLNVQNFASLILVGVRLGLISLDE
jgi:DNA-binding CsgD family transcriptional regulator